VRAALVAAGLQLASIAASASEQWSSGTVAAPTALGDSFPLRSLTAMEADHLFCSAAEPYRDPTGQASAATLLAERQLRQSRSSAISGSAWRRRWGVASGFCQQSGMLIQ
jgi:tRNA U34 5-methylaminomethyl-2-thiouridine-forming methyltransferase MnmC